MILRRGALAQDALPDATRICYAKSSDACAMPRCACARAFFMRCRPPRAQFDCAPF